LVEGNTHYDIAIATKGYPYAGEIRDDGQTQIKELADSVLKSAFRNYAGSKSINAD